MLLARKKTAAKTRATSRSTKPTASQAGVGAGESVDAEDGVRVALRRYGNVEGPLLVLAHGAGAGQDHPWMVGWCQGLADLGLHIVTFDFAYTSREKRTPDKNDVLERCWSCVLSHVRSLRATTTTKGGEAKRAPLHIGGKSMGGRIASQIAAKGEVVAGLVFFGYPLHPPGKPEQLRIQHWNDVRAPTLFVQGTRDPFGTPAELARHTAILGAAARVHAVEGGDHSLAVPKKLGVPQADSDAAARRAVADFVRRPNA